MLAEAAGPDQRAAKKMRPGHCTKKKSIPGVLRWRSGTDTSFSQSNPPLLEPYCVTITAPGLPVPDVLTTQLSYGQISPATTICALLIPQGIDEEGGSDLNQTSNKNSLEVLSWYYICFSAFYKEKRLKILQNLTLAGFGSVSTNITEVTNHSLHKSYQLFVAQ